MAGGNIEETYQEVTTVEEGNVQEPYIQYSDDENYNEEVTEVIVPSDKEASKQAERNIMGKYIAPISIVANAVVIILEACGIDIFTADDVTTIIVAIAVIIATIVGLYGVFKNNDYTTAAKKRTQIADQVIPSVLDDGNDK